MQSEAYRLTGFTAVVSALGFLLRWLQNMRILDPETGLATPRQGISYIVAALIVLTAAALGGIALYLKRCDAPKEPERALVGKTFLYTAFSVLPAVLLAAAGVILLTAAWPESEAGARRISGAAAIAAGIGTVLIAGGVSKPERAAVRRIGACLLIVFGGLWLIAEYKSEAADPVIWRFAVEILAICAALMAYYYVAGYFFGEPDPWLTIFFCFLGSFLCIMSAVDEHTLAESVCFAAVAVQLMAWGYILTANLRRAAPEEPAAPEEA